MVSSVLFSLLLVPSVLTFDVRDLCPGVNVIHRAMSSAEGPWFTVLATRATNSEQCGMDNNQPPCECTGLMYSTNLDPPDIPTYNTTVFGYNTKKCVYELEETLTTIVDESEPWAVFILINKETGRANIGCSLGTDNHRTYIIFYFCDERTADGDPIVIVVARTKEGLSRESQKLVDAQLKANHISKDKLVAFDNSHCPDLPCIIP